MFLWALWGAADGQDGITIEAPVDVLSVDETCTVISDDEVVALLVSDGATVIDAASDTGLVPTGDATRTVKTCP